MLKLLLTQVNLIKNQSLDKISKSKKIWLRAKIALSAGEKFGADNAACLHWASAVELLHNASLSREDFVPAWHRHAIV